MSAFSCGSEASRSIGPLDRGIASLKVTSSSFNQGQPIPERYTCYGDDLSPDLRWDPPPTDTQSLVLIADDPDTSQGVFTHWVVYDMKPDVNSLGQGAGNLSVVPGGGRDGINDFGRVGYGGPCPPPGLAHNYRFYIYAVNIELGMVPDATAKDILKAIRGSVVGLGSLEGSYARP